MPVESDVRSPEAAEKKELAKLLPKQTFDKAYQFFDAEAFKGGGMLTESQMFEGLKLEDEKMNSAFLKYVAKGIEAFLWKLYEANLDEYGLEHITFDMQSKKDCIDCQGMTDRMKLRFAGTVSQSKTSGSLELCKIFGVQLYLNEKGAKSLNDECCVPAWSVKVVTRADLATVTLEHDMSTLHVTKSGMVLDAEFYKNLDLFGCSVEVPIKLWLLRPITANWEISAEDKKKAKLHERLWSE